MAKSLSSSHSSPSLSDTKGSSSGVHSELPQSLEDQGFKLGIIPSIQPLSSCAPPLDSRSPQEYDPETRENAIQTPASLQAPESSQWFCIHPMNPLFHYVVICLQCPYSPSDHYVIPLDLSPRTYQIPRHRLFPLMDSQGEIQTSSLGHSEIFSTHTPHVNDEQGYEFPREGCPFTERVQSHTLPETSGAMFPLDYAMLA